MPTYTVTLGIEEPDFTSPEVAAERFVDYLHDLLESGYLTVVVHDDDTDEATIIDLEKGADGTWQVNQ